jgi:hypothetical protein
MRSSKSRSRSKPNRPRTIGNIINRVFDSSGPEGKVRGTPQQIIDKYLTLSRDAQLSNDRVATENFQQHAEHYTRMLGEAMREMAAEQDQRRDSGVPNGNQNGNGYPSQNSGQNGGQNGQQNGNSYGQNGNANRDRPARDDMPEAQPGPRGGTVIELADEGDDNGLVETPEARSRAETARSDYVERAPQVERQDRPERQDRRNDRPRYPQNDRPQTDRPQNDRPQNDRPQNDRKPLPEPVEPAAAQAPAPSSVPAALEPLAPMMPSFASLPDDAPVEAKPAAVRRPRAPRKPKAPGGSSEGGPAEAAE